MYNGAITWTYSRGKREKVSRKNLRKEKKMSTSCASPLRPTRRSLVELDAAAAPPPVELGAATALTESPVGN
jgi:hypothetical protein